MEMNKKRYDTSLNMFVLICVIGACVTFAAGSCEFPTDLQSGTWVSSDQSSLTFNSSTIIGYTVTGKGQLNFNCELKSGDYYIVKSETFTLYSSTGMAVMCMKFTQVKSSLYKYTIYTTELADADYQRVRFLSSTTTAVTDIIACTDSSNTGYSLLMAEGQMDSIKIQCPNLILGKFSYSFNNTDCTNMTGSLDVCTDLNKLDFNYTACSTQVGYSAYGEMNCLYSTTSGTATVVYVYNLDNSTDESSTYRFSCFMFESSGSYIYGTQYPKDCHSTQNSSYVPGPGATFTLLAGSTCEPSDTSSTSTVSVSSASLVAGVIAGLFVLLLLAGLLICFCCYKNKKKVEPVGKPPLDTVMPAKGRYGADYDNEYTDKEDEDELETIPEIAPISTAVEVGSSMKHNGYHNGFERPMSKEISLHFRDMKEMELARQRNQVVDECPITAANPKDPHWTPTFDGSIRPRMELSYVKPDEYNGVLRELHPIPPQQRPMTPPRHVQTMPPLFEPSPPPSPTTEHKKKKKKKKKKHVKINEDEN